MMHLKLRIALTATILGLAAVPASSASASIRGFTGGPTYFYGGGWMF